MAGSEKTKRGRVAVPTLSARFVRIIMGSRGPRTAATSARESHIVRAARQDKGAAAATCLKPLDQALHIVLPRLIRLLPLLDGLGPVQARKQQR